MSICVNQCQQFIFLSCENLCNLVVNETITLSFLRNCLCYVTMIQKEEIEHMGWLARIELSEADKDLFVKQISSILDYFAVLDEVETAEVDPTYHVLGIKNVVREDEPKGSLSQSEVLRNAAKKEDGYIKGPRIL